MSKKQGRSSSAGLPVSMSLNPVTLSFNNKNASLEKSYSEESYLYSIRYNRLALFFSIIAYSIFGLLDAYLVPEMKYFFWFLRYAVFLPVAGFFLISSYFSWYQKYFQSFFLFLEVFGGVIIIIMIVSSPSPVNYSYYAGLILVFMMAYTASSLRFIWATLGGVIIVVLYEIAAIVFNSTPSYILVNNNFFFIGANLIGMIASYGIERSDRRGFYLNYLLEEEKEKVRESNNVLEERVIERTSRLNDEIIMRTETENHLSTLLEEKEVLLKELYHRTKNNMQVISSLISLESSQSADSELKETFSKIELKIQAMAQVHEELYESDYLSRINFRSYIENIVPLMIDTYSAPGTSVSLEFELDDIYIMIDSAIPCGLILSELILNVMRHAFTGRSNGKVFIRLSRKEGSIELFLSDNGVGVDKDFDFRNQKSLGLETIFALGEHQLKGTINMQGNKGVSFLLVFRELNENERI